MFFAQPGAGGYPARSHRNTTGQDGHPGLFVIAHPIELERGMIANFALLHKKIAKVAHASNVPALLDTDVRDAMRIGCNNIVTDAERRAQVFPPAVV